MKIEVTNEEYNMIKDCMIFRMSALMINSEFDRASEINKVINKLINQNIEKE